MKLCKDQLAAKLLPLFADAEPGVLDDAVAQAKNTLAQETKRAKHADLEKLFDAQIATLKDRGVPEQIVELLQNQKGAVLAKASEMTIGDGNLPFLPVIPRTYLSPNSQMAMVRNDGKSGYTHLNPNSISDEEKAPQVPYYAYDIEDGTATLGKTPEAAEKVIASKKRLRHTAAEDMALATHTDVLSRHFLWSTGSRYEVSVRVPSVCLGDNGGPGLIWDYAGLSCDRWGSASCGSR